MQVISSGASLAVQQIEQFYGAVKTYVLMSNGSRVIASFVLHASLTTLLLLLPLSVLTVALLTAARHSSRCSSFTSRACCIVNVASVHAEAAGPSRSCCSETAVVQYNVVQTRV